MENKTIIVFNIIMMFFTAFMTVFADFGHQPEHFELLGNFFWYLVFLAYTNWFYQSLKREYE